MIPQLIEPAMLKEWLDDGKELALFDVREYGLYGTEHLLFAVSLPYSRLEIDVARLAPRASVRMVLVDDDGSIAQKAADRLAAVGYSAVYVLNGGNQAWTKAGYLLFAGVNVPAKAFGELVERTCETPRVPAQELVDMRRDGRKLAVLDGRPYAEYQQMTIPGAISCPAGELAYRVHALVPDEDTTIVVSGAGRADSMLGAQTLINLGVKNPVYALEDGVHGWCLQDLPLENGGGRTDADIVHDEHLRQAQDRSKALAERLSVPCVMAEEVRTWQEDAGVTVYLCDVRTDEEYADGTLRGALHTPGGELIHATDHYIGVRGARLVVFDNDGIRAPVVAGWLRQSGHDAYVLGEDLDTASRCLSDPAMAALPLAEPLPEMSAVDVEHELQRRKLVVVDVRSSAAYCAAHIPGSIWSIRPALTSNLKGLEGPVAFVADDAQIAALAATELEPGRPAYLLRNGVSGWRQSRYEFDSATLPEKKRIDYLFFMHDSNKRAARQYLASEAGLLQQMDEQELQQFSLK